MADTTGRKSSPALIAAAWLIVLAPTAWGLTYTVQNALKLFKASAPASPPASPPASAVPPGTPAPAAK